MSGFLKSLWETIDCFVPEEFQDDPERCSPIMILTMNRLRRLSGMPIIIHQCWAADGHSERSYHYTGQAVDFHFAKGMTSLEEFAAVCAVPDFMGVGFYPFWSPRPGWHVDLRASRTRLYWYKGHSGYLYGFKNIVKAFGGRYA